MAEKFTNQFTPEHVQALFGDASERARAAMEKSAKFVEEFTDFAKGNVEAVMTSGRVAVQGAETLGQDFADYGKKHFEGATAAFKSFAAAKSPTELFQLQSDYAKSAFDNAVAQGSKFSESWLKLAGEIVQPLSSRVAVAAEKIKAPAL
ncbi:MAG TPA: TIGR01841 family phasin [Sphingomonas sp.]|nr:TIGR01841 family phasin [Sphingomonas sp.]